MSGVFELIPLRPSLRQSWTACFGHGSPYHATQASNGNVLEPFPETHLAPSTTLRTRPRYAPEGRHNDLGQVFAFGSVSRPAQPSCPGICVAPAPYDCVALASGESGHALRILPLYSTQTARETIKTARLEYVERNHSEAGEWAGDGAEIRQVCFGAVHSGPSFLAVRTANSVSIFCPRFEKQLRFGNRLEADVTLERQKLQPNLLFSIGRDKVGDATILDVAFSVLAEGQVATLDSRGKWFIWRLSSTARHAEPLHEGYISAAMLPGQDPSRWSRIDWIVDSSTLLACDGQALYMSDVRNFTLDVKWPDLRGNNILDVRTSSSRHEDLFVTTSSHIWWFRASCAKIDSPGSFRMITWEVLFSRPHCRDSLDRSLKCFVLDQQEGPVVFLYSRSVGFITSYALGQRDMESSTPRRCFSVVQSPLAQGSPGLKFSGFDKSLETLQLVVMPCSSKQSTAQSAASDVAASHARFFCIVALDKNLILHSEVYYDQSTLYPYQQRPKGGRFPTELLNWEKRSRQREQFNVKVTVGDIFPKDEEDSGSGVDTRTVHLVPRNPPVHSYRENGQEHTISNRFLYDQMSAACGKIYSDPPESWNTFLDRTMHSTTQVCSVPAQLLSFSSQGLPLIHDVYDASESLARLTESADITSSDEASLFRLERLPWQSPLDVDTFGVPLDSAATIYRHGVQRWVKWLPKPSPSKIRLAKERIARHTSLLLSLSYLRVSNRSSGTSPSQTQPTLDRTLDRSSGAVGDALARLGTLTTVKRPDATANSLADSLLVHWTLALDPSRHDYCTFVCDVTHVEDTLPNPNTFSQPSRLETRNSGSKSSESYVGNSQPARTTVDTIVDSQPTAASQTVAGRFGGRFVKKSLRKSGF